jgi:hypothetical protein
VAAGELVISTLPNFGNPNEVGFANFKSGRGTFNLVLFIVYVK